MDKFIVNGNSVNIASVGAVENSLPVANYILVVDPKKNVSLKEVGQFKLPKKMLVDNSKFIDKVLKCYASKDCNLGVSLSGYKGTGKTVLAKELIKKSNMPCIYLSGMSIEDYPVICDFLKNKLFDDCIIFIDEFDKEIRQERNNSIVPFLSLMDGNSSSKLLFILTSNAEINELFNNRLSRVRYNKTYSNLTFEEVESIVDSELKNKEYKANFMQYIFKMPLITIDVVINCIEEINLFDEPLSIVAKDLNLVEDKALYDLYVDLKGKLLKISTCRVYSQGEIMEFYVTKDNCKYILSEIGDERTRFDLSLSELTSIRDYYTVSKNGFKYVIKRSTETSKLIY